MELSVDFTDPHFNASGADLIAKTLYDKLRLIREKYNDDKVSKSYSKIQVGDLLDKIFGSTKGNGNPLLQYKTLNWSARTRGFDNRLDFADPLFFERSWIQHLHKEVGPIKEEVIYKSLSFFYLWKDYFNSLVAVILNNHPSKSFIRTLKKLYKEKNEKEQLSQLKEKFNF